MFMVSGWWLLATFWIGGCVGILLATLLRMARYGDDQDKQVVSDAPE